MERLSEMIRIRVSDEDRAAFTAAAEAEGLSLSAWARHHLKRLAKRRSKAKGTGA
jgi:predicted HicB family RNase H-like nuclease